MYRKKLILLLLAIATIQTLSAQKSITDFVTSWKTDNSALTGNDSSIYLNIDSNFTYNYEVDWNNDGIFDTSGITGGIFHQYGSPGVYTIRIRGLYPSIQFGHIYFFQYQENRSKLIEINQWGNQQWKSLIRAFVGCDSMNCLATDVPILDSVNNLMATFANCSSFNANINQWDVSNVESLQATFSNNFLFNQPLGNWNVARVKSLSYTFYNAHYFNQNINSWQVDSVRYFANAFTSARSFNQPLSNWNVSRGTNLSAMFSYAESFNQNINSWNISNASIIVGMFIHAKSYNQPMDNWDVSGLSSLAHLFHGAESFNQDLSSWNTSYVNTFSQMFLNAKAFDRNLGSWDLSSLGVVAYNTFDSSGISTANYDSTLIAWNSKYRNRNVTIGASDITYCSSAAARISLIANGWTFIGDTISPTCVVTELKEQNTAHENSFKIFPNPTNGITNLEIMYTESEQSVLIYNQMGQMVRKVRITEGKNKMDLSYLTNGIYYLRIGNESEKIVVQH
ncbi:MAG: surface protein [Vicingaceae bacterium]|jgi:surface protein